MDETIRLIQYWSDFKDRHPQGSIEEFCKNYVSVLKKATPSKAANFKGMIPPDANALLIKLIGRIAQCYKLYATAGLAEVGGLKQIEDFYFLNAIVQLKEVRKTDVITTLLFEVSSGMDIINRLRDKGLIEERASGSDKRARLLRPTEKGETVLQECYRQLAIANDMIWKEMSPEDKILCIELLRKTEAIHSDFAVNLKGKAFQDMVKTILGVCNTPKI
jgi:DNA-binding MarR family transcriptional regulator